MDWQSPSTHPLSLLSRDSGTVLTEACFQLGHTEGSAFGLYKWTHNFLTGANPSSWPPGPLSSTWKSCAYRHVTAEAVSAVLWVPSGVLAPDAMSGKAQSLIGTSLSASLLGPLPKDRGRAGLQPVRDLSKEPGWRPSSEEPVLQ